MSGHDVIVLKTISDFIDAAIWHDFLIAILVTSASEGKLKNLGIDYGVGKCLVGETEVLTPKGPVELRRLHKGDKIIGVSEKRLAIGEVTEVFRSTQKLLEIKTKTGMLYSGPKHRFYSFQTGWVQASRLLPSTILTHIGEFYERKTLETLHTRRKGRIETIMPRRKELARDNTEDGTLKKIHYGDETKPRYETGNLREWLPQVLGSAIQTHPHPTGTSLSRRNCGWRRDCNHSGRKLQQEISFLTSRNHNIQYIQRIDGLDNFDYQRKHQNRPTKTWSHKHANSPSRLQDCSGSSRDIALYDNQEETFPISNRIYRGETQTETERTVLPTLCRDILGNSKAESFKWKETGTIQGISAASEREKLFDIATTTGNYFANNYLVHNSSLMLNLCFTFIDMYGDKFRLNPCFTRDEKWNRVFEMLHGFPYELEEYFYKAPKRYPGEPMFFLLDDIQRVFGKSRSRDNYVRSLRDRCTTARPQLAVLMATAPDIGELAYPWRYFFNFEIKIAERGYYEVQRLKKWTMFDNPYQTMARLDYKGEVSREVEAETGLTLRFPPLPSDVQTRYDDWRSECNKRFDEGEGEWRLRSILNVLTDEARKLLEDLVVHGSYERQHIITVLKRGDELKLLLNCGLVERFGDTVVPTKQARKMVKMMPPK